MNSLLRTMQVNTHIAMLTLTKIKCKLMNEWLSFNKEPTSIMNEVNLFQSHTDFKEKILFYIDLRLVRGSLLWELLSCSCTKGPLQHSQHLPIQSSRRASANKIKLYFSGDLFQFTSSRVRVILRLAVTYYYIGVAWFCYKFERRRTKLGKRKTALSEFYMKLCVDIEG